MVIREMTYLYHYDILASEIEKPYKNQEQDLKEREINLIEEDKMQHILFVPYPPQTKCYWLWIKADVLII